ncbi:hypothetical protein [Bacillus cereus]
MRYEVHYRYRFKDKGVTAERYGSLKELQEGMTKRFLDHYIVVELITEEDN